MSNAAYHSEVALKTKVKSAFEKQISNLFGLLTRAIGLDCFLHLFVIHSLWRAAKPREVFRY